jgi:hypothetical protein
VLARTLTDALGSRRGGALSSDETCTRVDYGIEQTSFFAQASNFGGLDYLLGRQLSARRSAAPCCSVCQAAAWIVRRRLRL